MAARKQPVNSNKTNASLFPSITDAQLQEFYTAYKSGERRSLLPFLGLLSVEGKPYHIRNHYMFAPLFDLHRPLFTVILCGRRTGKTQNISGSKALTSALLAYYKMLFVCPLHSQVKRISTEYMTGFFRDTPFRDHFIDTSCTKGVLRRTYKNHAEQEFSYALLSADRIRSVGADEVIFDEFQDINDAFVPVISETLSASNYGFSTFSGTPKTLDNSLGKKWDESSQGIMTFRCSGCNKENLASTKFDMLKMIGKSGIICARCGKPLDCFKGYYTHLRPERRSLFAGYHIPQAVHPLHCTTQHKWDVLLYKMENYPTQRFYNEILAESFDSATSLVTQSDVVNACDPQRPNTVEAAKALLKNSSLSILSIDWGGGGADGCSTTAITLTVQLHGSDKVHVAFMTRLSPTLSPLEEVAHIFKYLSEFKPIFLAHDYGGAGNIRESTLIQNGYPLKNIVPYTYDFAPKSKIIRCIKNPSSGSRSSYMIDKSRSLSVLCAAIKAGKVSFPSWNTSSNCLEDIMHIGEERRESTRGSDYMVVVRKAGKRDDFIHSINYGCSSLWYIQQKYPLLSGQAMLSDEEVEDMTPKAPQYSR